MSTHREIERSAAVRDYCPALALAFASIATIRIRNQATIGGNLAHADPAQDPPPMLMALGAAIEITGPHGARTSPVGELFVDVLETSLEANEVITGIRLPPLAPGTSATYLKFLPRTEDDYATVSVAARVRLDGAGRYEDVAVCLGAAGPTPIRARRVEAALNGERPTAEGIASAAALVRDEIDPLDDLRGSASYKRDMAVVHVRRALTSLLPA
ncbi:MAG TPA: FAD binding domain-containing protein, partial [Candidatus Limnocylindria bacterium]|nr:FAD binding domain-containing protein [Candidatus Limnocylindria bacterium]